MAAASETTNVFAVMADVADKLLVLDYINDFCEPNGLDPINRVFFAVEQGNPGFQFHMFASLMCWLLRKSGVGIEMPRQFEDDPNTVASNMLYELKSATGIDVIEKDVRSGFGFAVCCALNDLLDYTLHQDNFVFRAPQYPAEAYAEEAEPEEDMEIVADDIEDEVVTDSDSDEDAYMQGMISGSAGPAKPAATAAEAGPDPKEWKLEVERVAPELVVRLSSDRKDWRTHIEQMNHYQDMIKGKMDGTKGSLERVAKDIEEALDRIERGEKTINNNPTLQRAIEDRNEAQREYSEKNEVFKARSEHVTQLTNELARLTEDLDEIKGKMERKSGKMMDASPVQQMKTAMERLKTDIKALEVRIGVAEHSLLQARLNGRRMKVTEIAQ